MTAIPMPLPANTEAEEALLGSLVIDPDWLYRVKGAIQPDDFSVKRNELVYRAMLDLARQQCRIDLVTLTDWLEREEQLDIVGGASYLTGLQTAAPTSVHAEYYAQIVREASIRRALVKAAQEIAKTAVGPDSTIDMLRSARTALADVQRMVAGDGVGMSLGESLDFYLALLERREAEKDRPKLAFPWIDLAALMPALDPGSLVGVVAEPGVGKTAFLENCAEKWASVGWRVAFFHYELSDQMMCDRRMQRASGVPIARLQLGGRLESEDWDRIIASSQRIEKWPGAIQYVHCPGWSMARVTATAQRLHENAGLDVVVLDYLNKVAALDRGGSMNMAQMRGADVEEFKVALEENGWVGLMAAQFDKAAKHAKQRTLSDARDTGELEDKANVGIVLDRPRGADGERDNNTEARVVKCNAGREGVVHLYFNGSRLSFESVKVNGGLR